MDEVGEHIFDTFCQRHQRNSSDSGFRAQSCVNDRLPHKHPTWTCWIEQPLLMILGRWLHNCNKILIPSSGACTPLALTTSSLEQVQLRSGKGKEATKSDLKLAIRSNGLSPLSSTPPYKTVCPNLQAWFHASLLRQISNLPSSQFYWSFFDFSNSDKHDTISIF